jgi:phosphate/sulfate permease
MVVNHGAGLTPNALTAEVRRWVVLDWVRTIAVAASLAMGIRALLLPLR